MGGAPGTCAGDGVGSYNTVLYAYQHLRRRPYDVQVIHLEVIHVRRWVYGADGAIDVEGLGPGFPGKPLREDDLEDLPIEYVLLGPLDHRPEPFPCQIGTCLAHLSFEPCGWWLGYRAVEPFQEVVYARDGDGVALLHPLIQMGVAYDVDRVFEVVEGQDRIAEHEDRLGESEGVR